MVLRAQNTRCQGCHMVLRASGLSHGTEGTEYTSSGLSHGTEGTEYTASGPSHGTAVLLQPPSCCCQRGHAV